MKKKILFGVFTLTILVVAGYGVNSNSVSGLSYLALNNIEALAQDETGTTVAWCYKEAAFTGVTGWKKFCDRYTNETTIYPCPENTSYGDFSESSKDRCTK